MCLGAYWMHGEELLSVGMETNEAGMCSSSSSAKSSEAYKPAGLPITATEGHAAMVPAERAKRPPVVPYRSSARPEACH